MTNKHARFSPSSAEKWMTCPGALALEATLPASILTKSSKSAEKGTELHKIAETALLNHWDTAAVFHYMDSFKLNDSRFIVIDYVKYVRKIDGQKYYEQKVDSGIYDCHGTVDCIIIEGSTLHIIDLKTGSGHKVEAKENKQLMIYAIAAINSLTGGMFIDKIKLHIVQPPLDNFDCWEMTFKELIAFSYRLKSAIKACIDTPTKYVYTEKGCQWCKAKTICPNFTNMIGKMIEDKDSLEGKLAYYLPLLPNLEKFIKDVESQAKSILLQGGEVRGYKCVNGRGGKRRWADEDLLVNDATNQHIIHHIKAPPSLLSPAKVEKTLKEKNINFDINKHIISTSGNPTLVKEEDPRPPINKNDIAAKFFLDEVE